MYCIGRSNSIDFTEVVADEGNDLGILNDVRHRYVKQWEICSPG